MPLNSTAASLAKVLEGRGAAPFLFVGSGFSRRYLGLESWSELLQKFCGGIKAYGYYSTAANGYLPKAASIMSKDFNELWWTDNAFERSREKYKDYLIGESSALKVEISNYLAGFDLKRVGADELASEVEALKRMQVDGIISTNWDLLLEELFPDYRTFIGQEQLLFSNPQSIAEIYKIHGCASDPESLILTEEDYAEFRQRNPYLAAKLVTIFAEHPIVFIGYSLNDPHIQAIIGDISRCLGPDRLADFERNLIFVVRANGGNSSVGQGVMALANNNINFTLVTTDDYSEVYAAIETVKRQVPARILRFLKEQMYELAKSSNPETKISVVDIDEIQDKEDVEFIVGVGVASEHKATIADTEEAQAETLDKLGYTGISPEHIFIDIIADKSKYDAKELLTDVYPSFLKRGNKFIPVFRYLRAIGIDSKEDLADSNLEAAKTIAKRMLERGFTLNSYRGQYERDFVGLTTKELIEKTTPEKVCVMIPYQPEDEVDPVALKAFLEANHAELEKDPYKSYFRKLFAYYDYLAYGFEV
jgi:23S rRNA U2552 (ribose-2'-O)-methylase RlmE/FtsJ